MLFCYKEYVVAVVSLLISIVSFAINLIRNEKLKERAGNQDYNSLYVLELNNCYSFETINKSLFNKYKENELLKTSDDITFFNINNKTKYRIMLANATDFDKKEFDNIKSRANKKFNKYFQPKTKLTKDKLSKMLRVNIIVTDSVNDNLYKYISTNSARNLTRAEGIINFVVCKNKLYVPPFYGDVDLLEIKRYRDSIKFIDNILA